RSIFPRIRNLWSAKPIWRFHGPAHPVECHEYGGLCSSMAKQSYIKKITEFIFSDLLRDFVYSVNSRHWYVMESWCVVRLGRSPVDNGLFYTPPITSR